MKDKTKDAVSVWGEQDEEELGRRYRRALSAVRPQEGFAEAIALHLEESNREKLVEKALSSPSGRCAEGRRSSRTRGALAPARKVAVAACTAIAVLACGGVAYAANVGGIQRTVQVWLDGDLTTATMTVDESEGSYELYDGEGNQIGGGGGVAIHHGIERPLTADELQEHVQEPYPETTTDDDGRMYLVYKGQSIDITDSFDDEGYCYTTIEDGGKTIYVTAQRDGGLASSDVRYLVPGKDFDIR